MHEKWHRDENKTTYKKISFQLLYIRNNNMLLLQMSKANSCIQQFIKFNNILTQQYNKDNKVVAFTSMELVISQNCNKLRYDIIRLYFRRSPNSIVLQQHCKILQYFGITKSQSIVILITNFSSIAKYESIAISITKMFKYCKQYCKNYCKVSRNRLLLSYAIVY